MNGIYIINPCLCSGILYHTKSRSTLKIHFNFKDKSIYVSGYGVLDAKRVSSVVLKGDSLQVTSGNVTHSWASIVSTHVVYCEHMYMHIIYGIRFCCEHMHIIWRLLHVYMSTHVRIRCLSILQIQCAMCMFILAGASVSWG